MISLLISLSSNVLATIAMKTIWRWANIIWKQLILKCTKDIQQLTIAQYAAGSWVISMLRFSTKLWQQNHRGLLSKSHLVALDGLPVSKADDGDYQIDEYTTADGQKWMLYPVFEEDCVNDISLFDEID